MLDYQMDLITLRRFIRENPIIKQKAAQRFQLILRYGRLHQISLSSESTIAKMWCAHLKSSNNSVKNFDPKAWKKFMGMRLSNSKWRLIYHLPDSQLMLSGKSYLENHCITNGQNSSGL